jgi:hypothetical protein
MWHDIDDRVNGAVHALKTLREGTRIISSRDIIEAFNLVNDHRRAEANHFFISVGVN